MFPGRAKEAYALYLKYKGQPVDKGHKLWEAAILDDFRELEKAGLTLAAGKAIMERMTKLSPDNATWKVDLAWFEGRIAALEK